MANPLHPRNIPLTWKLVSMVSLLLLGVAVFLYIYFPRRFEERARSQIEARARGIASIVANIDGVAMELDQMDAGARDLQLLSATNEVAYAVTHKGTAVFATYKTRGVDTVPDVTFDEGRHVKIQGNLLHLSVPIKDSTGKAVGDMIIGFSLESLATEREATKQIVLYATIVVFVAGVLITLLIGFVLVGPMRRMADVANRIARGDLSQSDLQMTGRDELGQLAQAFDRMLRSLRQLAGAADRVASGDLTERLNLEGQVAAAFNRMVDAQQQIVREISGTASQLAGAAAEIYAASQEQEAAASQQSAGMEEVRRTMQSLLDAAAHISDSAKGVLGNAEKSRENTDSMAGKIAELSGHTNRMTEILDVIRDIADRSDLLALNASLEATRAGEGGRAFSLVATEMRRLAERVTASVQDVKLLVSDVRASGSSTVMATEEGRKLAESTTLSARQITMVTQQQRTGTEQVTQSMRDIANVLTQSVAASQQTRSSAENLKNQAERLSEMVGRFQLEAAGARLAALEPRLHLQAAQGGGSGTGTTN